MTWTTKSFGRAKEYIVIKHRLNDINGIIGGVKFRAGYGVVEKNSKAYFTLKQLPLIKDSKEYPITHLKKLKFITRPQDIKMVYGQDVYHTYLKAIEEQVVEIPIIIKETIEFIESMNSISAESGLQCSMIKPNGEQCKGHAEPLSPSSYCRLHLLKDPKLGLYGIEIPTKIIKTEFKELNDKVLKQLEEISR